MRLALGNSEESEYRDRLHVLANVRCGKDCPTAPRGAALGLCGGAWQRLTRSAVPSV